MNVLFNDANRRRNLSSKANCQRRICFIYLRLDQIEIQMQTDNCSLDSLSLTDINV